MTDEQINAAIARECGWTDIRDNVVGKAPGETANRVMFLPNYCNDLNAMHEAEEALKGKQFVTYGIALSDIEGSLWGIRATARQRAEAFLRTLGKWKEGE